MRLLFLGFILNAAIMIQPDMAYSQEFDIQGHRGARGILPENTIPGFLKALELGVTTLEMDVVITGDSLVLVSHEPYFNSDICTDSTGNRFSSAQGKKYNIYKMSLDEIWKFDCGSIGHSGFPEQQKAEVQKPLLKDVIKEVERHIKSYTRYEVKYNIEIKSSAKGDNSYHPSPERFSKIVYDLIDQYLPWERVIIQSFDFRVLRYWNKNYPHVNLAVLIETPGSVSSKLKQLGFQPQIYSPNYRLINKKKVDYLHQLGIKVIPWTVNDPKQMIKLKEMGVDGLITDYPNRAANLGYTLDINIEE